MNIRIFYRNRSGYDTRIMAWQHIAATETATFRSLPMTDPANANIDYIDKDTAGDLSYQAVDADGVTTKKISGSDVIARDQADIDKDWAKAYKISRAADLAVVSVLSPKLDVQLLMTSAYDLFVYLRSLQTAASILDTDMDQAGQDAKSNLGDMEINMVAPIGAIRAQQVADLTALDPEE